MWQKANLFFLNYAIIVGLHLLCNLCSAQCEYDVVSIDNSKNEFYLESKPIVLDLYETQYNGRLIEAKLIRRRNQYVIELSITQDSYAQKLNSICFERGTKLSFLFQNNDTATLIQFENEICGIRRKGKNDYNTVSNYSRFLLTREAYEKLKEEEITLMKIISTGFTRTFVLKSELEIMVDKEMVVTNPSRFFIDNIPCLTHPSFD